VITAWADTQAGLVNNVFNGFKICFPAAFLTLLVATHNILLSVFAIMTVAGIVACVLGFCKAYLDWGLGVAESIAAVIVIGFAVDFTVHLAHMYVESDAVTRTDRMVDSGRKMGVTVVMGALTTLGAGCFLWMCTLTFFTKFAILIISTICFSLTAALLFFMPLVATFGPEGDAFDVGVWLGCGGKTGREEKEPPPRAAQQAGEEKQP
jgi:predicted RND superfamily exporter protein